MSEQDLVAPLQLLHDFGMMQDDEGVDEDGESARRDGSSGGRGAAAATSPLGLPVARVYPRVSTTVTPTVRVSQDRIDTKCVSCTRDP